MLRVKATRCLHGWNITLSLCVTERIVYVVMPLPGVWTLSVFVHLQHSEGGVGKWEAEMCDTLKSVVINVGRFND